MDYRFSKPANYCKDCGQELGLYSTCHSCRQQQQQTAAIPPMPPPKGNVANQLRVSRKPLPPQSKSVPELQPTSLASYPSAAHANNRFSRSRSLNGEDPPTPSQERGSIYYDNYAAHLPPSDASSTASSTASAVKKKLWKKVRKNEKLKESSPKVDMPKSNTKLWDKFIKSVADKIPTREERGPESDGSDWEGETHVSRVLREYYEKKKRPLPYWVYDNKRTATAAPKKSLSMLADNNELPTPRKQRLWEREPAEPRRQQQQQQQHPQSRSSLDNDPYGRRPNPKHIANNDYYDRHGPSARHSVYSTAPSSPQYGQQQQQQQQQLPSRTTARYSTSVYDQNSNSIMQQQPQTRAVQSRFPGSHNQDNKYNVGSNTNPFENSNDMSPRARVRGPRDVPAFQTRYRERATTTAGASM